MVVAVDGPAGVGKSTVAARVAREMNFLYLNSGSFYRALSQAVLASGRDPNDSEAVIEIARSASFSLSGDTLCLNGEPVHDLQTDLIDRWSPLHSRFPEVRALVNEHLRRIAESRDVVVDGRDMSTVAFPDAELKIFLDATVEARATRRFNQGVSVLSKRQILKRLKKRDSLDRNKPVGKLKLAQDALYIDTSDLTIEEVCDRVVGEIRKRQSSGRKYSDELRDEKSS